MVESHRWSKPQVVKATGGQSHRWSKPQVVEATGGRSHRWSKPQVVKATGCQSHRWSKPQVFKYHVQQVLYLPPDLDNDAFFLREVLPHLRYGLRCLQWHGQQGILRAVVLFPAGPEHTVDTRVALIQGRWFSLIPCQHHVSQELEDLIQASLMNKGFDRKCCVASDCTCNPGNACDSEVVGGGANASCVRLNPGIPGRPLPLCCNHRPQTRKCKVRLSTRAVGKVNHLALSNIYHVPAKFLKVKTSLPDVLVYSASSFASSSCQCRTASEP